MREGGLSACLSMTYRNTYLESNIRSFKKVLLAVNRHTSGCQDRMRESKTP